MFASTKFSRSQLVKLSSRQVVECVKLSQVGPSSCDRAYASIELNYHGSSYRRVKKRKRIRQDKVAVHIGKNIRQAKASNTYRFMPLRVRRRLAMSGTELRSAGESQFTALGTRIRDRSPCELIIKIHSHFDSRNL